MPKKGNQMFDFINLDIVIASVLGAFIGLKFRKYTGILHLLTDFLASVILGIFISSAVVHIWTYTADYPAVISFFSSLFSLDLISNINTVLRSGFISKTIEQLLTFKLFKK